jgi:hypothetical protein
MQNAIFNPYNLIKHWDTAILNNNFVGRANFMAKNRPKIIKINF